MIWWLIGGVQLVMASMAWLVAIAVLVNERRANEEMLERRKRHAGNMGL